MLVLMHEDTWVLSAWERCSAVHALKKTIARGGGSATPEDVAALLDWHVDDVEEAVRIHRRLQQHVRKSHDKALESALSRLTKAQLRAAADQGSPRHRVAVLREHAAVADTRQPILSPAAGRRVPARRDATTSTALRSSGTRTAAPRTRTAAPRRSRRNRGRDLTEAQLEADFRAHRADRGWRTNLTKPLGNYPPDEAENILSSIMPALAALGVTLSGTEAHITHQAGPWTHLLLLKRPADMTPTERDRVLATMATLLNAAAESPGDTPRTPPAAVASGDVPQHHESVPADTRRAPAPPSAKLSPRDV